MKAFCISVRSEDEDHVSTLLWEAGTLGVESRDSAPGQATLLAYFEDDRDVLELASALSELEGALLAPSAVPEVDWVARFREGFRPRRCGRFRIVPVWDTPRAAPDVLVIDPGRAFGTGSHETTRLCLAALERLASESALGRVLDLGTGTGLLGVAALRLGAAAAIGVDNDPDCVEAARRHARLNGVPLNVVRSDAARAIRPRSCDLVLANLTAALLTERAGEIAAPVAPGGRLVLSGFLEADLFALRPAFAGLGPGEASLDGEWAALVYRTPQ